MDNQKKNCISFKFIKRLNRLIQRDIYYDFYVWRNKICVNRIIPNTKLDKNSFFFLSIVCIIKNEDNYLDEWIHFHRILGVEHFFIYDNGCSQATVDLLKPYVEIGLVTYISFPHIEGTRETSEASDRVPGDQNLAYADCINRFGMQTRWLLPLDLDEFMFPAKESGYETLTDLVTTAELQGYKGIEVRMHDFGSSWHEKTPEGLVIENFTLCAKSSRNTVKTIARTDFLKRLPYSRAHRLFYKRNFYELFNGVKIMDKEQTSSLLKLNHYVTKSFEEYQKKKKSNFMAGKYTDQKFIDSLNLLNEIESSGEVLRFLPKVKKSIGEFYDKK